MFACSGSCCLQQLCIHQVRFVDVPYVHVLSAHGELLLYVESITTCAITTLISNSPNLILLHVVTKKPLCDENGASVDHEDYMHIMSKTFTCHKLLTVGDFVISREFIVCSDMHNTNLISLWH